MPEEVINCFAFLNSCQHLSRLIGRPTLPFVSHHHRSPGFRAHNGKLVSFLSHLGLDATVKRIAIRRQKLIADKSLYPQTIVCTHVFFRDVELIGAV